MKKAILFLVLALGVFATAEAQKSPMQKEVLELYRRASLCKSQGDFASVSAEGEAYLNNNPGSPDRNRVIILLARSYRCLGKNEESVKYYKMVKESIPSMDPQQMRDIWDDRSAFDKFIIEADQFIEETERKQNNTASTTLLGLSAEQLIERYGSPLGVINGREKREKSPVRLGLSEVLDNPQYVYDSVYKFKKVMKPDSGGYILITCGILNGKTVFIEYKNYNNSIYRGEAGFFSRDEILLITARCLDGRAMKSINMDNEDSRLKYYKESGSGAVIVTQEGSGSNNSSPWISIFSNEGFQAYRKFKTEYNSSELNNL